MGAKAKEAKQRQATEEITQERKSATPIEASFFHDELEGKLYEEIADGRFVEYDMASGGWEFVRDIFPANGDRSSKIVPIVSDAVAKGAVLLPTMPMEYGGEEQLLDDIRAHIHAHLDISEEMETFSAYYVLLTWLYDRFNSVPYLRAMGDTGSGKSRFLDTIGRICYKPMISSGAATAAPIFRLINRWKGTMVIDEGDFGKSDTHQDIIKIFNTGFERGRPVIRCNKDDPNEVEFHEVYGPKVISTRYTFTDKALESRCLTEIMKQTNRKDMPYVINDDFFKSEVELRNKLLMFRFRNWNKVDPKKTIDVDVEPRLRQATHSFAALLSGNEALEERFKMFIIGYQNELIEERSTSWEGQIINAIKQLIEEDELMDVSAGLIRDKIKESGGEEIGTRLIGKIMRSLGLETRNKKTEGRVRKCMVLDAEKLQGLYKRYINTETITSEKGSVVARVALPSVPSPEKLDEGVHQGRGAPSATNATNATNATGLNIEEQDVEP